MKPKKLLCICFWVLIGKEGLVTTFLPAQTHEADSLKKLLLESKVDTSRVNLLNRIIFALSYHNPKEGKRYAQQALKLARQKRYPKGEAYALNNLGVSFFELGDYAKALHFYQKALPLFKKHKLKGIVFAYNNIGMVAEQRGQVSKALQLYQKALQEARHHKSRADESLCLNNIGVLHHCRRNYLQAEKYYLQSLAIDQALGDHHALTTTYNNLGLIARNKKDLAKTRFYFQKGLALSEAQGDKQTAALQYLNLAEVYLDLKQIDSARFNIEKAEQLYTQLNHRVGLMHTQMIWANWAMFQKNYPAVIYYSQQALTQAQALPSLSDLPKIHHKLFEAYKAQGQFTAALAHLQQHLVYQDSLFSQEKENELHSQELKEKDFENEQLRQEKSHQAREIARQKAHLSLEHQKQSLQMALALVSLALFLVIGGAYYRQSQNKKALMRHARQIDELNQYLSQKVAERTADLARKNAQLSYHSYQNSHILRRPVANILGIVQLLQAPDKTPEEEHLWLNCLQKSAEELDGRNGP
ncbi:MAG: hypothetical protein OHK0053_27370 [Microscillaceae bacterium]